MFALDPIGKAPVQYVLNELNVYTSTRLVTTSNQTANFLLPGPGVINFVILAGFPSPNMEYLKLPFIPKRFTPSVGR